jgi:hypothetical protein
MCGKVIIRAYDTTAERSDKIPQNATVSAFAKPGLPTPEERAMAIKKAKYRHLVLQF